MARAEAPSLPDAPPAPPPAPLVEEAPPPPPVPAAPAGEVDADNDSDGYTPGDTAPAPPALQIGGYVDVGFVNAQGDGSSYAPGDTRVPADYGTDTFAPAVNSRGDVGSTNAGLRFVDGFLPRSAGTGGRPSFLINTLSLDLRLQPGAGPVMVFSRVQFLPRFGQAGGGDVSRFLVEQAFARIAPFESLELSLSVGKFDSVFGIEYLDNQANIRTGITPSLAARYTTGQSTGAKLFYRLQIAPIWSALSLNAAVTNGGTMVETLQTPDVSVAGAPVLSARLGYELNLAAVQVKLGGSVVHGPRNDQRDREAGQRMWGVDARLFWAGLALSGEYVHVDEDEGLGPKVTALGTFPLVSEFHGRAFWAQASYTLSVDKGPLRRIVPYGRYDHRHAWFGGFDPITVDRFTGGLRIDLWDMLALKGEYLKNRELEGAPQVANDVYTSSLVCTW